LRVITPILFNSASVFVFAVRLRLIKLRRRRIGAMFALGVVAALVATGCKNPTTTTSAPFVPPAAVKMPTTSAAVDVVKRAREFHTSAKLPRPNRHAALGKRTVIAAPEATGASLVNAAIRAELPGSVQKASVAYAARANATTLLTLNRSGIAMPLALQDATAAEAEYADGYLVYRRALNAGGDRIVRPSASGFEDYFLFETKPNSSSVEYELTLPPAVVGLRLSSGVLELLGANGTPLFHAAPPYLVDSAGKTTKAVISVSGCAVDRSPQLPWGRAPKAPGANSCHVSITWDEAHVKCNSDGRPRRDNRR
jgi:hypothetical protein